MTSFVDRLDKMATEKSEPKSNSSFADRVSTMSADEAPVVKTEPAKTKQPTPEIPKKKEKAGYLAQFGAGFEQGLTPLAVMAAKGAVGGAHEGVTGKGNVAGRVASGAIEGAFDPSNTLVAKLSDKDFNDSGMGSNIANIAGNVAGEVAKIVGTGGIGALDTIAKLGTKGAAKLAAEATAKQIPRKEILKGAVPYIATKATIGNVAGMGGADLAASQIQKTDWFQNLSPEDQYNVMNITATAGGLAGGGLASKGASGLVQRSTNLSGARDKAAARIGLPTYEDVNVAKKYNELSKIPGVDELMKKSGLTPEEVTKHIEDAGLTVKNLQDDAVSRGELSKHILEQVKNPETGLMPKASKLAFDTEDKLFTPEVLNQEVPMDMLKELNKQGSNYAKAYENATGEALAGEYSGANVAVDKHGEYTTPCANGDAKATIKPNGDVELKTNKNNADLISNEEDTHALFNDTAGAIHQLAKLTPDERSAGVDTAQKSLTDSFAKQLNTLQEHKLGTPTIVKWLRGNLTGDKNSQDKIIETLKTPDGKIDGQKVMSYLNAHPDMLMEPISSHEGAPVPGQQLAGSILGHLKEADLSEKTLEKYAPSMARGEQTEAQRQNALETAQQENNKSSSTVASILANTIYPVDQNKPDAFGKLEKQGEAVREFTTALSMAATDHEGFKPDPNFVDTQLRTANNSKAPLSDRLEALENLGPVFTHVGGLLRAPKGTGFGKVELAKSYKTMANELGNQMMSLRVNKWIEDNPGENLTPYIVKQLKRQNSEAMASSSIYVPGETKGQQKSLSLLNGEKVGSPTHQLVKMAETVADHSRLYGLNGAKGRDMLGASFARLEDARLSNLPLSGWAMEDVKKLRQRINKDKIYHKNAQNEYKGLTDVLDQILGKGIESVHGQEGVATYSKMKNLQRAILDFRDNHPVLQKRILGGGDREKLRGEFGTSPDFGERIADISQSVRELTDHTGEHGTANEIEAHAKQLLNASKTRMIVGGSEGHAALEKQLQRAGSADDRVKWYGEHYKTNSWQDVLNKNSEDLIKVGEGRVGKPIAGGMTLGERILNDPDKAKGLLAGFDRDLNPDNKSHDSAAVERMAGEFASDIKSSITNQIQTQVKEAMDTGDIVTAMDQLQSFGGKVQSLMSKSRILSEAFAQYPLTNVMKAIKEGNNKEVANFIQSAAKSDNPVANLLSKERVFEQVQKQAIQKMADDVNVKRLSPAELKAEHFEDMKNFKGSSNGLLHKLGAMAVRGATMGFLHAAASKHLEEGNRGSPAQQRAWVTQKFLEFTLAPDKVELDGRTKADWIKEQFHKSAAMLQDVHDKRWKYREQRWRPGLNAAEMGANQIISPARQFSAAYDNANQGEPNREEELIKAKRNSFMLPGY